MGSTHVAAHIVKLVIAGLATAAIAGMLIGGFAAPQADAQTTATGSVIEKIRELNTASVEIRQIAFTPSGGALILHGTNDATWIRVPQNLADKVRELLNAGTVVRSAAFSSSGWVLLHGTNDATWSGIPQDTVDKIRELYAAGNQMKQVAFTPAGGWVILHGFNGASWNGVP
jgi:hypothetical protein